MSFIPLAKADLDVLEKQKRDIHRRQTQNKERKQRFFNAKKREMGIDKVFIQQQIDDKKAIKEKEKLRDIQRRVEIESAVAKIDELLAQKIKQKKDKTMEVSLHQRSVKREMSDTWYLNNPKQVSIHQPPRTSDIQDIPSCAIQKFNGEDLQKPQRIKQQQQKLRTWCKEIASELKTIENDKIIYDSEHHSSNTEILNQLQMIEQRKQKENQIKNRIHAQFNQRLSAEKRESYKQIKKENDNEKHQEIEHMMQSKFLNETFESTINTINNSRFIPYHFKGFDQQTNQQIFDTQKAQIQSNLNKKNIEKQEEKSYLRKQEQYQRELQLNIRQSQRIKRQQMKEMAEYHKQQMIDDRKKLHQKNQVYANEVKSSYFEQFQTSAR